VNAKVNALFFAFTHGDINAVQKMFPTTASWNFSPSPTGDGVQSAGAGIRIQPTADVRPQLAQAVRSHDSGAVLRLFPSAGDWEFHLQASDTFAASGLLQTLDIDRMDPARLADAVASLSRFHFAFSAPVRGKGSTIDHVSPKGTVFVHEAGTTSLAWQATGAPLASRGKHRLRGSGNIRIYCENGLFSWIGLGAASLE